MPEPEAPKPEAAPEAQPVPIVRGQDGKFRKAKLSALPSLSDRFAAMDAAEAKAKGAAGEPADDEGEESDETESDAPAASAPAAAKPPEPKPRRETVEPNEEEASVVQQRLQFTEWKRKQRETFESHLRSEKQKHDEELRTERGKFDEERQKFTPRMEKAERVLGLMESADYEALAKEAGYEDWEKFQGHVLGTITDPNYKRTRAIEKELAERKAKEQADLEERETRERTEREQAAARQNQQQRAQAIAGHKKGLSEAMAKSPNKTVSAMADDPVFVNTIFEIQRQNYDPSTETTVSPEQAIRMAMRGGQRTIREDLRMLRDRLVKADLDDPEQVAAAAAVAAAVTPEPAKPKAKASKTGVVPASATVEPAGTGKFKGPKDPAWKVYREQKMAEADDIEEQERLAKRAARGR